VVLLDSALAQLPKDAIALRMSSGDSMLPTRCWLAQPMPVSAPDAVAQGMVHSAQAIARAQLTLLIERCRLARSVQAARSKCGVWPLSAKES